MGTSHRQYGFIAWFSVFEEQVANLLPQHRFESAWFNNQSHLVAKQENIMGEKEVRKFGQQSISLMLCSVLLHAVNLRHGTDSLRNIFYIHPEKATRKRMFLYFLSPITYILYTTAYFLNCILLISNFQCILCMINAYRPECVVWAHVSIGEPPEILWNLV
jgi:hypothetical protein